MPIAGKHSSDIHVHGPELRTRYRYLQGLCVGVSDTVISRSEHGARVTVLVGNHEKENTAFYWVSGHEQSTDSNELIDSIDSEHHGGTCGPTLVDPILFCKASRATETEVTSAIIERLPSYMASYGTRTADTMCGVSGLRNVPQGSGGGAVLGYRYSLVEYLYKAMVNLEPAQIHSQIMWSGGTTGFTNIATRLLRSTIWCVLGHMTIMLDKMHGIIVFPQHRFTKEEVISYQDLTVPSHMYSLLTNTSVISSAKSNYQALI